MIARVVVTVQPDGSVQAQTTGMYGPDCLDTVGALEELLEASTERSAYTSDFAKFEHEIEIQQKEQANIHE